MTSSFRPPLGLGTGFSADFYYSNLRSSRRMNSTCRPASNFARCYQSDCFRHCVRCAFYATRSRMRLGPCRRRKGKGQAATHARDFSVLGEGASATRLHRKAEQQISSRCRDCKGTRIRIFAEHARLKPLETTANEQLLSGGPKQIEDAALRVDQDLGLESPFPNPPLLSLQDSDYCSDLHNFIARSRPSQNPRPEIAV